MSVLFRLIPALLLAPVMVYLYFFLRRAIGFWLHPKWSLGQKAALAVFCILLWLAASNLFRAGIVVVMHLFVLCLIFDLLNLLLRRGIRGAWLSRLHQSGVLPVAATLLILLLAYGNMHHIVQTEYTIQTEKAIRPEGYTVAFLSDLHFGLNMDTENLARYADQIASQSPDLVLLGGDIVDEGTSLENMQQALQILGSIPSTFGTCYVYGNHDRARASGYQFTTLQLEEALSDAGIRVLSDETAQITEDLVLVGREDASFSGSRDRAPSAKLLENIDPADFILMLDHQPLDLAINQENGVDLQLSGHTHAGQIWPIGQIGSLLGINAMNYGYRQVEGFQIIVSSGMAGWGYPLRTSGHSEYVMIYIEGK